MAGTKEKQKQASVAASVKKEKTKAKEKSSQKWKCYQIDNGKLIRTTKFCPKCGVGVFMAKHKDRYSCGKCGYTEFLKKFKS